MNLITHLLKKDIRRARALLVVWFLLLLLEGALIGASGNPGDRLMQTLFAMIRVLVPLAERLLLIVIVPFVVQEEPLVGTTAFWLTRPISGSLLLKAKSLFAVVVLVLAPFVVQVIVLAASGITPHAMALAVPEIILEQVAWLMPVAIIAVLTPSFGRYAIIAVSLLVATVIVSIAVQWMLLSLHPEAFTMPQTTDSSSNRSHTVVAYLLMAVLGGAVVAHQYLTRHTLRSILAAGLGVFAGCLVVSFWSWNFLAPPSLSNTPPFDLAGVKMELGSVLANDISLLRGKGTPQKMIQGGLSAVGLPGKYVLRSKRVQTRLQLPNGSMLVVKSAGESGVTTWRTEPFDSALGTPVVNTSGYTGYSTAFFMIDADTYHQYLDQPLAFSADIDFVASEYSVTAGLSATKGAHYDHDSDHLVVTDVLRVADGVDIVLRERKPDLLLDRQNNNLDPQIAFNQQGVLYFLRNKKRHEAVMQKQDYGNDISEQISVASMLVNRLVRLSFGPEENFSRLTPELTPEWLADAELVRLELKPVFTFSKSLTVENFKLNGKNNFESHLVPTKPDLEALDKIVLPENPTKEQVKEYVRALLLSVQRYYGTIGTRNDPYVAKLEKVGSGNLNVLIEARNSKVNAFYQKYIDGVITRLVRPEDKDLILQALPSDPELAEIVVAHDWQAEARETLIAELSRQNRSLPPAWINAVASFHDPSTYADLKTYFIESGYRTSVFAAIRKLPGFELTEAVDAAWKKAKYQSYEAAGMLSIAAEFGHEDALDTAANLLRTENNDYNCTQAREMFKKFTPATGDDAALLAWFGANRGKLTFDSESKKFLARP